MGPPPTGDRGPATAGGRGVAATGGPGSPGVGPPIPGDLGHPATGGLGTAAAGGQDRRGLGLTPGPAGGVARRLLKARDGGRESPSPWLPGAACRRGAGRGDGWGPRNA